MPYVQASAYDVLWSDAVVVEEGALTGVMPEPLPDEPEAEEAPAPRKRASAAKTKAKAAKTAKRKVPNGFYGVMWNRAGAEEEERKEVMPALHEIVVRPVVTEKSSAAYQTRREYAFEVHPEANKYQIRDALQKLFGVTVTDVRTMQVRRHAVTRGRTRGTTARWKKAIVTLKDGDSIAVFEG